MTVPAVREIAKARGKSAAQIGLRWIVQQGLPLTTAVWYLELVVCRVVCVCVSVFECV